MTRHRVLAVAAFGAVLVSGKAAHAQSVPDRNETWGAVSSITTVTSAGLQLVMPRVGYFETDTTLGWKARWHVSVLAPVMTLTSLALVNEVWLKDEIQGERPGCDESNRGVEGCSSYGAPSTHTYAAAAAFGHGAAVFLVDTLKWNDGRFNAPAFVGDVAAPLVLGIFTIAGRTAGNYESGGQALAGTGIGLGAGLLTGIMYGLMQDPGCGYSQGFICW